MPAEEIVILRNVNVSYGDIKRLEDVNLSVCEHDFLGIIGPNGGGKSTLLKVMLGLVQPQAGTVVVMGKAPSMGRNRIGYVSQRFSFDRDFPVSVLDVVIMGHYGRRGLVRRYTKEDRAPPAAALEQ